jgi:hypothetical protein
MPFVFNDSALADQMYPGFLCRLDACEKKIAYSYMCDLAWAFVGASTIRALVGQFT